MERDRPVIVSLLELTKLQVLGRLWVAGWLVGAFGLGVAGYQAGRDSEHLRASKNLEGVTAEVHRLEASLLLIQSEQRAVTETYVKAWENQQSTAELLTSWGGYVKERAALAEKNADMPSTARRPTNKVSQ